MKPGDDSPRIVRAELRDNADPERIDRVWERIERTMAAEAKLAKPKRRPRGPWRFAAAALAAGFAGGVAVGVSWMQPVARPTPQAELPHANEARREVFAAGETRRRYPLPGGGEIELTPGSIVDTVDDGEAGLVLRLMRGEATLSTRAADGLGRATQVAMRVGGAEIVTGAGAVRVRLEGDNANLQVLEGSAEVASPDQSGMRRMTLAQNDETTVPVVRRTASLDQPPLVTPSSPHSPAIRDLRDPPSETSEPPAWAAACANFDYAKVVELVQQQPGGIDGAVASAKNIEQLQCLGTGGRDKDPLLAIRALESLFSKYKDSSEAMTAAHDLARIYGEMGMLEKKAYWEAKKAELSKGLLLTADALCQKVEVEDKAGNFASVLRLAQRYKQQYPGGSCTNRIDELVAKANAALAAVAPGEGEAAPDGASEPDAEEVDPYEE